jgi:hypothetical protein
MWREWEEGIEEVRMHLTGESGTVQICPGRKELKGLNGDERRFDD